MLLPNTLLLGRDKIGTRLSQGGMGAVYEAVDRRLRCIVAIRKACVEDGTYRRAFEHEAHLGKLASPGTGESERLLLGERRAVSYHGVHRGRCA